MNAQRPPAPHLAILGAAAELPAGELLELHRGVSRLAARVRMADPVYRERLHLGQMMAASLGPNGAHIAHRSTGGQ